jgi:hypothetical protein
MENMKPGPRYDEVAMGFDFEEGEWLAHIPDTIKEVSVSEAKPIKELIRAAPHMQKRIKKLEDALNWTLGWLSSFSMPPTLAIQD